MLTGYTTSWAARSNNATPYLAYPLNIGGFISTRFHPELLARYSAESAAQISLSRSAGVGDTATPMLQDTDISPWSQQIGFCTTSARMRSPTCNTSSCPTPDSTARNSSPP